MRAHLAICYHNFLNDLRQCHKQEKHPVRLARSDTHTRKESIHIHIFFDFDNLG